METPFISAAAAKIVIRPATVHDAAVLASLSTQLGYPATPEAMLDRHRTAPHDPNRILVVAEIQSVVVGSMEVAISFAWESGAWSEIRGLVVEESSRSAGVGTALVEYAKLWTRQNGLTRLRVRTNETRLRTHGFYERHGFTKTKSQRVYDAIL